MTTLPGVRTRRHRLLVGGEWSDAADGGTANHWEPRRPFGGSAGKTSRPGLVGRRDIFEAMTQIRSVAFDVGRRPS